MVKINFNALNYNGLGHFLIEGYKHFRELIS